MNTQHANLTPNSFMKTITIIYLVMLVGMLLFGSVILFISNSWEIRMPAADDSFLYAVPLATFVGVVLGRILYKRRLDELAKTDSLKDKLIGFQTALIIKFVLVEAPFLLGVVATLLTNNIFYLMISGTLIMYYITLKPSREKVKKDLNLSTKMSLYFNDRNQILN